MKLKINTKHKSISEWLFEGNRAYVISAGAIIASLIAVATPGIAEILIKTPVPPKPAATAPVVAPSASSDKYVLKINEEIESVEEEKPVGAPDTKDDKKPEAKPTEDKKETPKPTEVPKPTESPKPTETSKPTEAPKPARASNYGSIEEALSKNPNLTVQQIYLLKNVYDAVDQKRGLNYAVLNEIASSLITSQQNGMVTYQTTIESAAAVNALVLYGDTFSKNGYDNTTLEMINNYFYTGSIKDCISKELILETLGFKEVRYFQNMEYKYLNELFGSKEVMNFYKSDSGVEYFASSLKALLKDDTKVAKFTAAFENAMHYGNTALADGNELFALMREAYANKYPDANKIAQYDAMMSPYLKAYETKTVDFEKSEYKNNTNYTTTPLSADKIIQTNHTKADVIKALTDNKTVTDKDKGYIKEVLNNLDSNPYVDLDTLYYKMDGFTVRKFDNTNMTSDIKDYAGQRPYGVRAIDINLLNTTDAEFYRYVIMHEYWHFISCATEMGNSFLTGSNGSGRLYSEGVTALLARRDAGYDKDNTYIVNSELTKIAAELVGDDTLLKAYLTTGGNDILAKGLEPFCADKASAAAYIASTDVMNDATSADTKTYGDAFKLVIDDTIKMITKSTTVSNGVSHNYSNMLGSLSKIVLQTGLGKEYNPKLEELAKSLKIDKVPTKNTHAYFTSAKKVALTTSTQVADYIAMKDMIKGLITSDQSFGYASPVSDPKSK